MRVFKTALATLLLLLAGAVSAPLATAQSAGQFTPHFYYASDYGAWSIASQQANTYTFFPISICTVPSPFAGTFFPFNTNAPILISDVTSANSEVVTPSALVQTSSQCGVTITPTNQHYTFHLSSGTGGLQEALNAVITPVAYPALVILDRNWYQQVSSANAITGNTAATVIGAVKGGAAAILEDITTDLPTYYVWSGTAYSATLLWKNTAPTIAAGAAAGTSPTVTNTAVSTQLAGTANVTSGTATTTGTLFTEVFPVGNTSAGGFDYAGSCTVTSAGPNSFTAFTVATSFAANQRTLTVTATAAPVASTAYQFAYSCK